MTAVFLKLFNMSIAAGWLVLAAVLFRCVFKKAPKRLRCLVWALVAIRLVLPFTIESPLSIAPKAGEIPQEVIAAAEKGEAFSLPVVGEVFASESPVLLSEADLSIGAEESGLLPEEHRAAAVEPAAGNTAGAQSLAGVLSYVWLGGVIAMALYAIASYIHLRLSMSVSSPLFDNVIACDDASTPFILGILRPKIVLPSSISEEDARYAIAHEKAHLSRGDHLIKPFAFALLSVYWFNPLMWVAYVLLCRDIELACDERVIKEGGAEIIKGYSTALINCSSIEKKISACPVAFGGVDVKERVISVLSYKKATFSAIAAALLCCAAIAVFLLPAARRAEAVTEEREDAAAGMERPAEDDGCDMLFSICDAWTGSGMIRIGLRSANRTYVIELENTEGEIEKDTGRYKYLDHDTLCLTSDDQDAEYRFQVIEDYLVIMPPCDKGIFADRFHNEACFKLIFSDTDDAAYHCVDGSGYLLRKNSGLLYIFGDPGTALKYLLENSMVKSDPKLAESIAEELSKLGSRNVGCRFILGEDGAKLSSAEKRYDLQMLSYTLIGAGRIDVNIGVGINGKSIADSTDTGVNRLTPGSLYARGGYRNDS